MIQSTLEPQEHQFNELDLDWTGEGDGVNWHDRDNWSGPRLPNQADNVTLDIAGDTIGC